MRNPNWHRDEIILALDLYFDDNLGPMEVSNPKIIALSKLLNRLPFFRHKPDKNTFRNPNGVKLKLSNFKALDPNYKGKGMASYSNKDEEVFNTYSVDIARLRKVAAEIRKIADDPELSKQVAQIEDEEGILLDSVEEGQILYKLHRVRERNRKVIEAKKKYVLKKMGMLNCEICEFNFYKVYGEIGRNYIECHHLIPLSNFNTSKKTRLEDLALVCANCHRMIHRDMTIKTIQDFKIKWMAAHAR